MNNCYWNYF